MWTPERVAEELSRRKAASERILLSLVDRNISAGFVYAVDRDSRTKGKDESFGSSAVDPLREIRPLHRPFDFFVSVSLSLSRRSFILQRIIPRGADSLTASKHSLENHSIDIFPFHPTADWSS